MLRRARHTPSAAQGRHRRRSPRRARRRHSTDRAHSRARDVLQLGGYLEGVLTGAWRVDLEGKPAGAVSADDEKHAKAKRAGIRIRREAVMAAAIPQAAESRAHGPALASKAEPGRGPKRLSLADLREAARRRREGAPGRTRRAVSMDR